MARDVNGSVSAALVIHQHAPPEQVVDHPENCFFVSWDNARGKNYGIVLRDAQQSVIVHGDSRKRRHWLSLRPAGKHDQLFRVESANVLRTHDAAGPAAEVPE